MSSAEVSSRTGIPAEVNVYGVTVSSAYLTFWPARSRAAPVTSAATSAGSRTSALTAPYTSAKCGKSRNSKNARSSGSVRGTPLPGGTPLPAGCRRASSSTVGTDADPTRCRCSSTLGSSSTKESTDPTLARVRRKLRRLRDRGCLGRGLQPLLVGPHPGQRVGVGDVRDRQVRALAPELPRRLPPAPRPHPELLAEQGHEDLRLLRTEPGQRRHSLEQLGTGLGRRQQPLGVAVVL